MEILKLFFRSVLEILLETKTWAISFALVVPIVIVIAYLGKTSWNWSTSETTDFVSAYGGTLGTFAGLLFIYVNFKEQQKQFERQSFENIFNKLIDRFIAVCADILPLDPNKGIHPLQKDFRDRYTSAFDMAKPLEAISEASDPIIQQDDKPLPQTVGQLYHSVFADKFRKNEALIRSFLPILIFLENSVVDDRDRYYPFIYSQMKKDEYRLLFYAIFCEESKLQENEGQLLRSFFKKFDSSKLFLKNDLELLAKSNTIILS